MVCSFYLFFSSGEDRFSAEATSALEEMTRGVALLAQVKPLSSLNCIILSKSSVTDRRFCLFIKVTNYDNNTGLPLVQLWNMVGEEVRCWDTPGFQNTPWPCVIFKIFTFIYNINTAFTLRHKVQCWCIPPSSFLFLWLPGWQTRTIIWEGHTGDFYQFKLIIHCRNI